MLALLLWMLLSGAGEATSCSSETRTMGCKESCPNGWDQVGATGFGCCSSFNNCFGDKDVCQLFWDCHNDGICVGEGSCECQPGWTGDHCEQEVSDPWEESEWRTECGGDAHANRRFKGTGKSLAQCKELCMAESDCGAIYGSLDGGDGSCWTCPCDRAECTTQEAGYGSYKVYFKPEPWEESEGRTECGGDAHANRRFKGTGKSLAQCQQLCMAESDCGAIYGNMKAGGDGSCWTCPCAPGECTTQNARHRYKVYFKPGGMSIGGFQCATMRLENVVPLRDASGNLVDDNGNRITANKSEWPDAYISAKAQNCWNAGSGDYVVETMNRGENYEATADECISTETNWEDVLSAAEGASETATFEVGVTVSASVEVGVAEVGVEASTSFGTESTREWSREQSSAQGGSEGTEICTSQTTEFETSIDFEVSAAPGLIVSETVTRTSYDATVWMQGDLQCLGADGAVLSAATITGEWDSVAYAETVRAGSNVGCQSACFMFQSNECPMDYCQRREGNCVALDFDCMDFSGTYSIAGTTIEVFQSPNCGGHAEDDQGTLWTYTAAGYVATVGNFYGYRGEYRAIDQIIEAWGVKRTPNDHISWSTYQIYDHQCCDDLRRALCYSCFIGESYMEFCTGDLGHLFPDCDIHTCEDTPGWVDTIGSTCADWADPQFCSNGSLINPVNGGYFFNYPENNCCACGKDQ